MLNDASGFKRIYSYIGYTNLRKEIDDLEVIIDSSFGLNPAVSFFCGRKNDRMKALLYEMDGGLICYNICNTSKKSI